jgi:hypothetical protein
MRKFLSAVPVIFIVMIIQQLPGVKKVGLPSTEEMWSGNILYRQITYDTIYGTHACGWQADTSWGEWRMQASIINNKGTASSSSNGHRHGTAADTCINVNGTGAIIDTIYANGQAPTELVLSIDDDAKEYGFTVDIPACIGKKISDRYANGAFDQRIIDDMSEGDSQIMVERYKLGKDRNILTGRIEKHDHPQKGVEHVQIWEWNLKKTK